MSRSMCMTGLCVGVATLLSGCGDSKFDCGTPSGHWVHFASSPGKQSVSITYGWTGADDKDADWFASAAHVLAQVGFAVEKLSVVGPVAAKIISYMGEALSKPTSQEKSGSSSYTTEVGGGHIWQWELQVCDGTSFKAKDFQLTPMNFSNVGPCCVPGQFAGDDPHGSCHENSPNLCKAPFTQFGGTCPVGAQCDDVSGSYEISGVSVGECAMACAAHRECWSFQLCDNSASDGCWLKTWRYNTPQKMSPSASCKFFYADMQATAMDDGGHRIARNAEEAVTATNASSAVVVA